MSGFNVDHQQLAAAGAQLSDQAGGTSAFAQQVQDALVPTKAWGLLGLSIGLFELYEELLLNLTGLLDDMGQHLAATGSAMTGTAQAYQQVDQGIQQAMRQITDDLTGATAGKATPA